MEESEEKHHRIKLWMGASITIVALTIDLTEMLFDWLIIGWVLNPIMTIGWTLLFWIWYKLLDVPFVASPKKFATLAVTTLVELIPALDALPLVSFGWTIGAIIMVIMVRLEDKGGIVGHLTNATMSVMQKRYKTYQSVFDDPKKLAELQKTQGKNVFAIKKDEIVEAAKGNKKYSENQYGRAVDMMSQSTNSNKKKVNTPKPNVLNLKQEPAERLHQRKSKIVEEDESLNGTE